MKSAQTEYIYLNSLPKPWAANVIMNWNICGDY